jgi:Leucine-rich repeat (LRR) protein
MNQNALEKIPLDAFSEKIRLYFFSCRENKLSSLDFVLAPAFSELQTLRVAHNRIRTLPAGWGKLVTSLRALDLSGNVLIKDLDILGELVSLEELSLKAMELEEVPRCVTKMQNLRVLHLKANKIRVVPDFLPEVNAIFVFLVF